MTLCFLLRKRWRVSLCVLNSLGACVSYSLKNVAVLSVQVLLYWWMTDDIDNFFFFRSYVTPVLNLYVVHLMRSSESASLSLCVHLFWFLLSIWFWLFSTYPKKKVFFFWGWIKALLSKTQHYKTTRQWRLEQILTKGTHLQPLKHSWEISKQKTNLLQLM